MIIAVIIVAYYQYIVLGSWKLQYRQKIGFFLLLKEINTFIEQGCIKLISNESKYIYNVTEDLYFKYMLFFWTFYS